MVLCLLKREGRDDLVDDFEGYAVITLLGELRAVCRMFTFL